MYVDIAKLAVKQTISLVVARQTKNFVLDHTETDPESIPLQIGSLCVGEVVATKAKPYTDDMIDRTVSWVKSKRNKKDDTTE